MAREARSQFAILGMLTLRPMSGYDLRQEIDKTIGHFWQESYGQLYPTLARLEQAGLVSSSQQAEGERVRQVYKLAAKGRAKLRAWLAQTPMRHVERNELLMKLFFATEVDAAKPLAHLNASRADATERLNALRELGVMLAQLADKPGYDYYWATVRSGELGLEAHIRWCDEVLARLSRPRA
jgi:DNA-binding PadR family transcriptional regulator